MATIDVMERNGTKLVIVPSMPQTTKRFILRRMPRFANPELRSKAQLSSEIALGEFMVQHRGTLGKVAMPNGTVIARIALEAGKALSGKRYGGMSKEEYARQKQAGAEQSLAKLRAIRDSKSGRGYGSSFSEA